MAVDYLWQKLSTAPGLLFQCLLSRPGRVLSSGGQLIPMASFADGDHTLTGSRGSSGVYSLNLDLGNALGGFVIITFWSLYDKVSGVVESLMQFASKTLTPRKMHLNGFQTAQMIAECHSFPNMYDMLNPRIPSPRILSLRICCPRIEDPWSLV